MSHRNRDENSLEFPDLEAEFGEVAVRDAVRHLLKERQLSEPAREDIRVSRE